MSTATQWTPVPRPAALVAELSSWRAPPAPPSPTAPPRGYRSPSPPLRRPRSPSPPRAAKRMRYDEPTMLVAAQVLWTHVTRPLVLRVLERRPPPPSDTLTQFYEHLVWFDAVTRWPEAGGLDETDALQRVLKVFVGRFKPRADKAAEKYYFTLVGMTRLAGELLPSQ